MIRIQKKVLKFIKNSTEANFQMLSSTIKDEKICDDKYEFKLFLHLIVKTFNNNYRSQEFNSAIEKLLNQYKNQIKHYFTNNEIFNIFKNNKLILLFLLKEKIFVFDKHILQIISKKKYEISNYGQYFMPEIMSEPISEDFDIKRKKGENDSYICELIRNDSIIDFIVLINKQNISLNATINLSIFETNPFLIKKQKQSLIEYAAFFGSIQIFQYLMMNGVELTPSLWLYAIHGKNPELIHLLEENHIECDKKETIIESIKCHHNKFVNYFLNQKQGNIQQFCSYILKYYNFEYLSEEFINERMFLDLCKNDYISFVQKLLPVVDINKAKEYSIRYDFLINPIKQYSKTPLYISVEKQNIEIVKLMLTRDDIDVNYININNPRNQMTALHCAVEKSNTEIVKLLLSYNNIDINCYEVIFSDSGCSRKTALHIAVENENVEIIKLLLSCNNIDVNIYMKLHTFKNKRHSKKKKTALYIATENDNIEITYLLCLHPKTDINIPYTISVPTGEQRLPERRRRLESKTPFQLAAQNNNQTICQILLMKNKL